MKLTFYDLEHFRRRGVHHVCQKGGREGCMSNDIFQHIDAYVRGHAVGTWEGTFRDYLALVLQKPSLAQRAHARSLNF